MKQFNHGIFILAAALLLLISLKKFQSSSRQTYGDLHLRNKEEVAQAFVRMELSLSEAELAELNNLIMKGMHMLPAYEREQLGKLQKKYAYKGHKGFNEDEVTAMRRLNYRGVGLLSEEDQARFHYLMLKATGKISGR